MQNPRGWRTKYLNIHCLEYKYIIIIFFSSLQFSNRATKKFRKKKKKSHDSSTDNCTIFHAWWLKVADGDLICWKQQRDKRFISIPPMTQATRWTMAARVSARFPRSGVGVSRMAKTDTRVPRAFTSASSAVGQNRSLPLPLPESSLAYEWTRASWRGVDDKKKKKKKKNNDWSDASFVRSYNLRQTKVFVKIREI